MYVVKTTHEKKKRIIVNNANDWKYILWDQILKCCLYIAIAVIRFLNYIDEYTYLGYFTHNPYYHIDYIGTKMLYSRILYWNYIASRAK